ncbi:MAG: PSD1 domain-containing protein [Acidobacteria bacterium]|nr:PSD1 domain-containing protein [Acidobacteriota bacterium]
MSRLLIAALVPFVCGGADTGEEFFEKKIRPVLVEKCYACHSEKSKMAMGGLRLDTAAALRKGGDSGPAITPGDPDRSLLIEAIGYRSLRLKMPPGGKLNDTQIAGIEAWIKMGAPDPRTAEAAPATSTKSSIDWERARKYWAFQPPVKPALPTVRANTWVQSPIDAFLLARLESKGLQPAEPIDRRSWLRRVTFDLTGLPPTPAEMDKYLKDGTADADRHVVDRLLGSPHYGERWARHWLDLVRFAETNGHEFDNDKLDAWQYRDYVIRAFNQDVPYHQFVREHIAGDLMREPRASLNGRLLESPLGSGMYWFGEVLNSATDSVKTRADTVDNQIDVMGKTFLGLTLACARCHDHKFDPIPTNDYYGLAGIMHSTYLREAVIDTPAMAGEIAAMHRKIGEINAEIRALGAAPAYRPAAVKLREGDILFDDFGEWVTTGEAFAKMSSSSRADSSGLGTDRLVGTLTSKKFKMPKLYVHVRMGGTKGAKGLKEREPLRLTVVADDHKSENFVANGKPGLYWQTIRMTKEIGRSCYFELIDRSRTGHIVVDRIILSDHEKPPAEEEPQPAAPEPTAAARAAIAELERRRAALEDQIPESNFGMLSMDEAPHNVKLHIRGSHENLGEEVPRHFLRVLAPNADVTEGSGRHQLADWMARNPLTPRVMVNRIWKHHFGQGLVRTTDNFGKMGEQPEHRELLDWLAVTFMEHGWSVKEMHRLIVLSSAYHMGNRASPQAVELDPRNALVHHMPVRRLEAEAIRDTILVVTGRLNATMYGPSVGPHISKYQDGRGKPASGPLDGNGRRSIYIQVRRNFITPMFLAFDYPLPVSTIGTRGASAVPAQALMLLNNDLVLDLARSWSQRVLKEEPDPTKRIHRLYAAAFARPPEDWERRETLDYIGRAGNNEKAWADLCHVLLNSAELIYVR